MKNRFLLIAFLLGIGLSAMAMEITSVSADGGSVTYQDLGNDQYLLTAVPTPGTDFEFVCWDDGSKTNPRTVTVTDTKAYRAVFAHNIHFQDGYVDITIEDMSKGLYTLEAKPVCDMRLIHWSNGSTAAKLQHYDVVAEEGNRIRPLFSTVSYDTLSGAGGYITVVKNDCDMVLTANENEGHMFVRWTDGETSAVRTVDYEPDVQYTAEFEKGYRVAKIGTTTFTSFQKAIDAAAAGDTITILRNNTEDVLLKRDVTIAGASMEITGNLTIPMGVTLTMESNLMVNNLSMSATAGSTSQLINPTRLTCTNAYMDITLEAGETMASSDKYYMVAVPFIVNVNSGIKRAGDAKALARGTDYEIEQFDAVARSSKSECWTNTITGNLMQPGKMYRMMIDGTQNTWRFSRQVGNLEGNANVSVTASAAAGAKEADKNWNAIANPLLRKAQAAMSGLAYAQTYNNSVNAWVVQSLADAKLDVAAPMLVQVPSAGSVVYADSHPQVPAAGSNAFDYKVQLSNSDYTDVLFLTGDDNSTLDYVIGRDVVKESATTVPQLWAEAFGEKLCAMDRPMNDGAADYLVTFYAPKTGNYYLTASAGSLPVTLWYSGIQLATLSATATPLSLSKGKNEGYVIRVGESTVIPTGLNQLTMHNAQCTMKAIVDGHLLIIRDGKAYNAQGQVVIER